MDHEAQRYAQKMVMENQGDDEPLAPKIRLKSPPGRPQRARESQLHVEWLRELLVVEIIVRFSLE